MWRFCCASHELCESRVCCWLSLVVVWDGMFFFWGGGWTTKKDKQVELFAFSVLGVGGWVGAKTLHTELR